MAHPGVRQALLRVRIGAAAAVEVIPGAHSTAAVAASVAAALAAAAVQVAVVDFLVAAEVVAEEDIDPFPLRVNSSTL